MLCLMKCPCNGILKIEIFAFLIVLFTAHFESLWGLLTANLGQQTAC